MLVFLILDFYFDRFLFLFRLSFLSIFHCILSFLSIFCFVVVGRKGRQKDVGRPGMQAYNFDCSSCVAYLFLLNIG